MPLASDPLDWHFMTGTRTSVRIQAGLLETVLRSQRVFLGCRRRCEWVVEEKTALVLARIYDCARIIVSYAFDCDPKDVVRGVTKTDLAVVVRLFILMLRTYVKEPQR
jgi:hypothetical protein